MSPKIRAVLFDFMGTCLDWHSSIVQSLPAALSDERKSSFALEWRQAYFDANAEILRQGLPLEDFDHTQRRVLGEFLSRQPDIQDLFSPERREQLVAAYHNQKAWSDVPEAIRKLKQDSGLEVYVHANGSTRLQLDITRSAGLQFDLLLSSEMLGAVKPALENYEKCLKLLKLKPEECVTVAAHAYDVRGARDVGMKTVYIYRWTDDIREDQEVVKQENDAYLLDMSDLHATIASL